ncbi:MAG: hypothetical protein IPK06_07090 [Ignavibacteriae bacterium]|nr:hypothetical protein [Ignavibacteriota bacterium]
MVNDLELHLLKFAFAFLISLNFYAQIESWWIGVGLLFSHYIYFSVIDFYEIPNINIFINN